MKMPTKTRAGPGISSGRSVGSHAAHRRATVLTPGAASSRRSFHNRHLSVIWCGVCIAAFGENQERLPLCGVPAKPWGAWEQGGAMREPGLATQPPRRTRFTLHEVREVRTVLGAAIPTPWQGEKRSVRRCGHPFARGCFRRRICLESARCGAFSAARPGFSRDPQILENPAENAEPGVGEGVQNV